VTSVGLSLGAVATH